jgi:hypothetical protein
MTDEQYTPTEAEIDAAIRRSGHSLRNLAAAYLRASRRAKQAETAASALHSLNKISGTLMEAVVREKQAKQDF